MGACLYDKCTATINAGHSMNAQNSNFYKNLSFYKNHIHS